MRRSISSVPPGRSSSSTSRRTWRARRPRRHSKIKAKLELDVVTSAGIKRRTVSVTASADLADVTGRDIYQGYVVDAIMTAQVDFSNGVTLTVGESHGSNREQLQQVQLRTAIRQHLDQELRLKRFADSGEIAPTKALTLIFIDKVDDYWPEDGRLRLSFEEEYEKARKLPKYHELELSPVAEVHGSYFARDRKGAAKDTKGRSEADGEAYELIMRDKQRLLSLDEPLRFIFSHSALREGWDNPNVFTIATLADSHSEVKKRQEIGRGLRLPVMSDGRRCSSREIAVLKVVANESYEEFAAALQTEIEEETGSKFERASVKDGRKRRPVELREQELQAPHFMELWRHISPRTDFHIKYDDERLLSDAARRLRQAPSLDPVVIRTVGARIGIDGKSGVETELVGEQAPVAVETRYPVGDLVGQMADENRISRPAATKILLMSERMNEAAVNPQQFLDQARAAVNGALGNLLSEGIEYRRRLGGEAYDASLFSQRELTTYDDKAVAVEKSVYAEIVYDSGLERRIAEVLDNRRDVAIFLKLPGWFTVDTPVGSYNPDWAYMKRDEDGGSSLCLVRESKRDRDLDHLPEGERLKVLFGTMHFKEIGVDFAVVDDPGQL